MSEATSLLLSKESVQSIAVMKENLGSITLMAINETLPFTVETGASNVAISPTLNQGGKPVAFFSRTLLAHQRKYPAIEKEALAVVEAFKHWSHLLLGRRFTLITDQRSVAFMFDARKHSKIKNAKIINWRLGLAPFHFNTSYRPG